MQVAERSAMTQRGAVYICHLTFIEILSCGRYRLFFAFLAAQYAFIRFDTAAF